MPGLTEIQHEQTSNELVFLLENVIFFSKSDNLFLSNFHFQPFGPTTLVQCYNGLKQSW